MKIAGKKSNLSKKPDGAKRPTKVKAEAKKAELEAKTTKRKMTPRKKDERSFRSDCKVSHKGKENSSKIAAVWDTIPKDLVGLWKNPDLQAKLMKIRAEKEEALLAASDGLQQQQQWRR